jgi:outer membrane protein TolC
MNNYLKKLKDLNKIVEGIQKRFPLKGSPIGYSGYLGIKSLQNYLKGTKETVRSQITAQKEFIQINTGNKISDWIPKDDTSLQFAEKYLPIEKREDDSPEMKITKAYKSYAEGTEIQIEAEKARFLPRVGVYGEAYAYNGSRDTATSYNAGLYLQMNLLSPTDIGIIEESKNNSLAIKERVEEMKQRDKAKFSSLIRMEKVFKENIILMNETQKLQEEQINNSQNLFSSGSINILQLAEVMNSVAEFYRKKAEVETEYLRIRSELTLFNPSNSGDLK